MNPLYFVLALFEILIDLIGGSGGDSTPAARWFRNLESTDGDEPEARKRREHLAELERTKGQPDQFSPPIKIIK